MRGIALIFGRPVLAVKAFYAVAKNVTQEQKGETTGEPRHLGFRSFRGGILLLAGVQGPRFMAVVFSHGLLLSKV